MTLIKQHGQKQVMKDKGVYPLIACRLLSREVRAGAQSRNLEAQASYAATL